MSQITVENILRQIDQLPPGERARLQRLIGERHNGGDESRPKPPRDRRLPAEPMRDRTREMAWVAAHRREYAGQWVALDGDRLIAASPVRAEISAAVKADGADLPLIHRIASPDEPLPVGI